MQQKHSGRIGMNKNNDEIEIDDITQTLRRMATETGSLNCLGCGHEHN